MKKLLVMFFVLVSLSLEGCAPALIMGGVSALKAGSAAQRAAKAKEKDAYTTYKIQMERLNLDREKEGLEPKQILTFEEWLNQK